MSTVPHDVAATALPHSPVGPRAAPEAAAIAQVEFARVYRDNYDFVWRNLQRLGVSSAFVDDALQDVFVVAHRRLAEFAGRSSIRTWLFAICVRTCQAHRRKHARMPIAIATEAPADPEDQLGRSQDLAVLDAILERLDDDQRAIFVMVELEQMSGPEIADVLQISVNTVYSRLRAGRQRFEREVARVRARRSAP